MARLIVGVAFGIVVGTVMGAAAGLHAEDASAEVLEAATAAHVDPIKLQGAINTTGEDPYVYLRGVGDLPPLPKPPQPPAASGRVACVIRVESRGNPNARNRSGAAGLGQFLPSTWATTPQGRAGLSVYDPAANTAAIQYMFAAGRALEFDAVRFYGC